MVFSTIIFLCVFLPLTIAGYYILPDKLKNVFLLLCSLFFYAWGEPKFVWLMLFSVGCNYLFGMWIHKLEFINTKISQEKIQKTKKAVVVLGVGLNLSLLFIFKYFTFVMESIKDAVHGEFDVIQIALPIGISFYTFQGLSYIIDVYREEGKQLSNGERCSIVQKNPLHLALYISMFPQLIAGPIVRYEDIRGDLAKRKVSSAQFASGLERFIIGLGKKAILANMTGKIAVAIFASDFQYLSMPVAWVGALAYTLQIYFDFSGYSDMAIGLGAVFGFHFNENFNYPYISKSIREFWRRWHISLSGWFRDYLYIPLGGNRKGNVYLNLLIVFLATGIWHGAAWGFLFWGLWHGFFLVLERILSKKQKQSNKKNPIPAIIQWMYTMCVVVTGWVLFNLVELKPSLSYLAVMFGITKNDFCAYDVRYYLTNQNLFFFLLACICCLPWVQWIKNSKYYKRFITPVGKHENLDGIYVGFLCVKRALLLFVLVFSFLFIINSSYNPFIYFRF